jgi:UDP-N-acetylmuramoyl-tripeptide--D-alanyl-D-alanine ligase
MDKMIVKEVLYATGGKLLAGSEDTVISRVTTDSREVQPGDLFIPLIGERFDAHKFLPQAAENGASAVLVSEESAAGGLPGVTAVMVPDTLTAMQDLAKYYLRKIDVKKISVTGSVGKTTTRDMIYYICSERFKTGRPQKNYNNQVGVPLTIFSLDSSYEMAVFEEGMDNFGQIHRLSDIIRPDTAVITNIGISHIENLKTRENIMKAKMEVADYMGADSTLVINASCDLLKRDKIDGSYKVVTCGKAEDGDMDYAVSGLEDRGMDGFSFMLDTPEGSRRIDMKVPGAHNDVNAALAAAACMEMGLTLDEVAAGLRNLQLTGNRLKLRRAGRMRIIDDTYNAAPASMESAINTLMHTEGRRRVAVLGGMNELGPETEKAHREVGRYAAEAGVDMLIGVGEKTLPMIDAARENGMLLASWYRNNDELLADSDRMFLPGDTVLIKGSNATGLEAVADEIVKRHWR